MNAKNDPMGRAILEYLQQSSRPVVGSGHPVVDSLRVFSPMFEEDEIPLETLFRSFDDMPEIERKALDMTKGRVLDVGAGSGCHSLVLQNRGVDVTAIDISPLSVEAMRKRGVRNVIEKDFFALEEQKYDTVLMMMNGIGIVGALERLPSFFSHLDRILAPGGQLLCDSSDISYVFEDEDGNVVIPDEGHYYGELSFRMQYKDTVGEPLEWLYIDDVTLCSKAMECGYAVEIVARGGHYDYLARITKV